MLQDVSTTILSLDMLRRSKTLLDKKALKIAHDVVLLYGTKMEKENLKSELGSIKLRSTGLDSGALLVEWVLDIDKNHHVRFTVHDEYDFRVESNWLDSRSLFILETIGLFMKLVQKAEEEKKKEAQKMTKSTPS